MVGSSDVLNSDTADVIDGNDQQVEHRFAVLVLSAAPGADKKEPRVVGPGVLR